ncbi:hypothetical protein [Streptomyces sp. 8K308]|uniref:SCO2584 family spore wall biosynthesis protein n=1 Tax=Streptomyces sp. 8K308 TaxID=2530388 RepID=UPI001A9D98E2|nr:hypothetical protein [Streptomyces sp. 8K308]
MPDDVGGLPSPNGEGPNSEDIGAADEAFASVVLDEAFIEAAEVHEPTAAERILYAALERAESEAELEAEAGGEVGFYRDPDLDPGSSDGLGGFEPGGPASFLDEEADGEDPDDEGRFDSSDYTRYLPELPDGEYDELAEQDGLAFGSPYPPYGGGYGAIPGSGAGPSAAHAEAPAGWRPLRWQRPVACVLAMVMGISVIAFALIAIQRAGSGPSRLPGPTPPAPTEPTDSDAVEEAEGETGEGSAVEAELPELTEVTEATEVIDEDGSL